MLLITFGKTTEVKATVYNITSEQVKEIQSTRVSGKGSGLTMEGGGAEGQPK